MAEALLSPAGASTHRLSLLGTLLATAEPCSACASAPNGVCPDCDAGFDLAERTFNHASGNDGKCYPLLSAAFQQLQGGTGDPHAVLRIAIELRGRGQVALRTTSDLIAHLPHPSVVDSLCALKGNIERVLVRLEEFTAVLKSAGPSPSPSALSAASYRLDSLRAALWDMNVAQQTYEEAWAAMRSR